MSYATVNGVRLFWEQTGESGDPLILVHGSWGDHHNWDAVVPGLSRSFRVFTYDRRGHSQSDRPATQGSFAEDAADLEALIEELGIAPAHVVANSGGAAIALHLAGERPDLFRTLVAHEPPLFGLLASDPGASAALEAVTGRLAAVISLLSGGEDEAGARQFVDTVAFGPGAWDQLPPDLRRTFVFNAPTFLDESRDPDGQQLDLARLTAFTRPALLTHGTTSAPFFPLVVDRLTGALGHAEKLVIDGAGHVPHLSDPERFVDTVCTFVRRQSA